MAVKEYDRSHGFREGKLFIDLNSKSEFFAGIVLSADGTVSHFISVNPGQHDAKEMEEDGIEPRRLLGRPDITCYLCPVGSNFSCFPASKLTLPEFLARWAQSSKPEVKPLKPKDAALIRKIFGDATPDISDEVDEIIKRNLRRVAAGEMSFAQLEVSVPVEANRHITDNARRVLDQYVEAITTEAQHDILIAMPQDLMTYLMAYEKKQRNSGTRPGEGAMQGR